MSSQTLFCGRAPPPASHCVIQHWFSALPAQGTLWASHENQAFQFSCRANERWVSRDLLARGRKLLPLLKSFDLG